MLSKSMTGRQEKSGEPFVNHPIQVASIIAEMEFDVESIVAALLHDVVEDTDSTREDIVREFGRLWLCWLTVLQSLIKYHTLLKRNSRLRP